MVRKSQPYEIERFEHIMAHRKNSKAVYVAALTIHIDDSGTHSQSPIAVAAGWIAPVTEWKKFIRQWEKEKNQLSFNVFHMADAMTSAEKTEFENWNLRKRIKAVRKLRSVINGRVTKGFAIWIVKQDYDDLVKGELRIQLGKSHYTRAVCDLIGWIELWRNQHNIREPIEYVFDRMSKGRGEIDQVFKSAEERGNELHKYGIYKGCHSFRDKAEILPLQAADMIAWLTYQRALADVGPSRTRPLVAETFNYFNSRKFKAARMLRPDWEAYVQHELAAREGV